MFEYSPFSRSGFVGVILYLFLVLSTTWALWLALCDGVQEESGIEATAAAAFNYRVHTSCSRVNFLTCI